MVVRPSFLLAALALPSVALAQNVAEVQVAPPAVTIKVGERTGLLATAFDRAGNVIPTVRVIWSSNNRAVASVDNDGTVTGVAGGIAIIEARVASRRGTAAVQVVGPAGAAAGGGAAPPAPGPAATPPAPSGPDVLAGQPTGTGPAAVLRIEPPTVYLLPSENTRVAPRALKDDGSPAAPVAVTWKSLRPEIASVDQNGVVIALAQGQGTVQVTSTTGLTATAPVVVQPSEIAIPEASPLLLSPGDVDTLRVVVPGQGGRAISPLMLQWSAADANVARVSLTGVVTAVAPGRTTLTVSGLLQTKTMDVLVHKTVDQLAVIPTLKTEVPLPIQGVAKFQVQALAADKAPVPEAPIRWTVADTSLATFDPATGTLMGRRAGKTTLTAKGPGPGLVATWQVRVIAAGLKLSTTRVGLPLARRYSLKASFADETGTPIGPATGVTWTSDNPAVAAVAVTADGQAVAYHSLRTGHRQIFLQPITGSDAVQLTQEPADNSQPTVSPDGETIAFVSNREGNNDIWLMAKDGSNQRAFTKTPQIKESAPHFLSDGSLAYLVEQKESGRTTTQVVKADLATGKVTPVTGSDLVINDFAASPGGDLLGLVVMVQKNVNRVYIQPVGPGGGAPVPMPTTGTEQMVSPAFLP